MLYLTSQDSNKSNLKTRETQELRSDVDSTEKYLIRGIWVSISKGKEKEKSGRSNMS